MMRLSGRAQTRIVLFNNAAQEMFRCSAEEALGQFLERFIPQRFRAAPASHVRAFAAAGVTSRALGRPSSFRAVREDGEEFQMEASISQIETAGKKLFTVAPSATAGTSNGRFSTCLLWNAIPG